MASKPILLIAGASRGIGASLARLAATRGYDVAVNYKSNDQAAASVISDAKASGARAIAIKGDMSKEEDVGNVFRMVETEFGGLTHFVFNCGITGAASRVEAVETATLRTVIDTNVLAAFFCARAAIPLMSTRQKGKGGAIVFVSSAAATLGGVSEYVWYAATKGAIDTMTIGLAGELVDDGIRVAGVSPGLIDTEIHTPGRLDRMSPRVPMKRAGQPDEVAEAILFLLSDKASYITGTTLRVSGGR